MSEKEPDKLNPTYVGVKEVTDEVARAVVEERQPKFEGHNPIDIMAAGILIDDYVSEEEEVSEEEVFEEEGSDEDGQTTIEFK